MAIASFDPAVDPHGHAAPVFRLFADGVCLEPPAGARVLRRLFKRGARAAVWYANEDPWTLLGFAIVMPEPQTVVWCWTRPANRTRKTDKERRGVMTELLAFLGVDVRKPVVALFRSVAAEAMRAKRKLSITFVDELPTERQDHAEEAQGHDRTHASGR